MKGMTNPTRTIHMGGPTKPRAVHYFSSNETVYPVCGQADADGTRYAEDVTCGRCLRLMGQKKPASGGREGTRDE